MKSRATTGIRAAAAALIFAVTGAHAAGVVEERLAAYQAEGAAGFSAERGAELWQRAHPDPNGGKARSCTTCHGTDLRQPGRQVNTGKVIEPLAPSANPKRLTRASEIEKWFQRNCDWTFGRACTPQEKGDLLSFIARQ